MRFGSFRTSGYKRPYIQSHGNPTLRTLQKGHLIFGHPLFGWQKVTGPVFLKLLGPFLKELTLAHSDLIVVFCLTSGNTLNPKPLTKKALAQKYEFCALPRNLTRLIPQQGRLGMSVKRTPPPPLCSRV